MEVDVELEGERGVVGTERRPAGLRAVGRAHVLLAQDVHRRQAQAFAHVRLGRQPVGRAELVRQREAAHPRTRLGLGVVVLEEVEVAERVGLCVVQHDLPLRGRHVHDVLPARARLQALQRGHDARRQVAERVVLTRAVELDRLGAEREAVVQTVHQPALRVRRGRVVLLVRLTVDAAVAPDVAPRVAGRLVAGRRRGKRTFLRRLAQRHRPGDGVHLLPLRRPDLLRLARLAEASARIDARVVPRAAQADDVAPVRRVHREARAHLQQRATRRRHEAHARHAPAVRVHGLGHVAAEDAQSARLHFRRQQLLEDPRRGSRLDRVGAAPAVARRLHPVRAQVVGAHGAHDLQHHAGAREVDGPSLHQHALVRRPHALVRELPAEPVDVVHQHDAPHAQARRLDGDGHGRLVPARHEQVRLDTLCQEGRACRGRRQHCGPRRTDDFSHR